MTQRPPRRLAYRPHVTARPTAGADTIADRAEVWGRWHGYTSTAFGVYHKGRSYCAIWAEVWLLHHDEISVWEAVGKTARRTSPEQGPAAATAPEMTP